MIPGNFVSKGNGNIPVAHASTDNILESEEILTTFYVNHNDSEEHWAHTLSNDGKIWLTNTDFDTTGLKYIVKFPDELAHILNDSHTIDYLTGKITNFDIAQNAFRMSGTIIEEDGSEIVLYASDNPYEYLTIK